MSTTVHSPSAAPTVADLRMAVGRLAQAVERLVPEDHADCSATHELSNEDLLAVLRMSREAETRLEDVQRLAMFALRAFELGTLQHRASATEIGVAFGQRRDPNIPMAPTNVYRQLRDWGFVRDQD